MAEIKRNLLSDGGLYIDKWWTGLYKNRSPLFAPVSNLGLTLITRRDALIDGLNMAISPQYSLVRRFGHSKACTTAFGSSEWPLTFESFQKLDGTIVPIVDTQTNVYSFTPTSKTSIYTKAAGAGQSSFNSVLDWLYWVDGISAKKFDGSNVWNMGIVAPTVAPTVTVTESGDAAVTWAASTWFSTMGILIDSNANAQQLVGVDANGDNPSSQFGLSSNGAPTWSNISGATTSDNTVTWTCIGPVGSWQANHLFSNASLSGTTTNPCIIFDPVSNAYYIQIAPQNASGTTSGVKPAFNGIPGSLYFDGTAKWFCCPTATSGNDSLWTAWQAGHVYALNNFLVEPVAAPSDQTVFAQKVTGAGTSASTYSTPPWAQTINEQTVDNELLWINLGSTTWAGTTAYSAWSSPTSTGFNVLKDGNGNLQICITAGVSGSIVPFNAALRSHAYALNAEIVDSNGNLQKVTTAGTTDSSAPTWNATSGGTTTDGTVVWTNQGAPSVAAWGIAYGQTTTDGTVIWSCVGSATGATWTANQSFYLPVAGFAPPTQYDPYGSADVLDSNGDVEFVVSTGVTGSSAPSWGAQSTNTTDNTVTWFNNGAPSTAGSLSWSSGYVYAYSYKDRTTTDFYSTIDPTTGVLPVPPGLSNPLPAPTGSEDGGVSTASPTTTITGGNAGAVISVTVTGSLDPQVDTIIIWRSKDDGSIASMFELSEIPNPPPISATVPGTTTFTDTQPDTVLNTLIIAPINDANDPPPSGLSLLTWYAGRLWGAVRNIVYFSGGPDTDPGNGEQSWPPANNFPVPGNVTALMPTSSGLIIATVDDLWVTTGTTSATFTAPILWQANFGIPSTNAFAQDGDNLFLYTSKGQIFHLSSSGLQDIGSFNGKQFAAMTPGNVYVAVHRSGLDEGVFICDGSANVYRYSQVTGSWDTVTQPVGGVGAIASIETSLANWQLLVGRDSGSGFLLKRDTSLWTDDSSAYSAFATVGSMVLASPRQIVIVESVLIQAVNIGSYPTVSIMTNEIVDISNYPATFTILPNPVVDPPQLVGFQNTIWMKRHDLKAAQIPLPQQVQHMQVKVNFGTDTVQNELLGLGIA